jgi:hypothetical protein
MMWPLLLVWLVPGDDDFAQREIRNLVYRAEVHGQREESLEGLYALLVRAPQDQHKEIVRAMAVIKYPQREAAPTADRVLASLSRPRAMLHHRAMAYVLADEHWLALGDWVGDYFLAAADRDQLVLETLDGLRQVVRPQISVEPASGEADWCLLEGADLRLVLSFVAKRMGLNSFTSSEIDLELSGSFPIPDWLSLLDQLCKSSEISWTRRRDNVMFFPEAGLTKAAGMFKRLDRKGENLGRFLQVLADTFGMDLLLDERLADTHVDIHVEEQPWDETLECLAIMNGFNWDLIQQAGEKPKLVIHGE